MLKRSLHPKMIRKSIPNPHLIIQHQHWVCCGPPSLPQKPGFAQDCSLLQYGHSTNEPHWLIP